MWGAPLLWGHLTQTPAGVGVGVRSEGSDGWGGAGLLGREWEQHSAKPHKRR